MAFNSAFAAMIYLKNGVVGRLRRIDAALGIHIVVYKRYPGKNGIFRHHNISACALNARDEIVFFRCHGLSHTVWAGMAGKRSLIHKFLRENGTFFLKLYHIFHFASIICRKLRKSYSDRKTLTCKMVFFLLFQYSSYIYRYIYNRYEKKGLYKCDKLR